MKERNKDEMIEANKRHGMEVKEERINIKT